MKLTPDQRSAVRCDDNLMLTACPGSGKTRVIISKLIRAIEDVRGTARTVACITYTNAAVHEIVTRAARYLLYVTDTADPRNVVSRFLRAGTGLDLC